jgi:hypothetical protein
MQTKTYLLMYGLYTFGLVLVLAPPGQVASEAEQRGVQILTGVALLTGYSPRTRSATVGSRSSAIHLQATRGVRPSRRLPSPKHSQLPNKAELRVQGVRYVLRHHRAEDAGFEPARAVNPTRFPSLPSVSQSSSGHTARRRLWAWQQIVNPSERSRMRLKLRLAVRSNWGETRAKRREAPNPFQQNGGVGLVERHVCLPSGE